MRDLKTSLSASDEVIVAGKVSSSQDGIVVRGGGFPMPYKYRLIGLPTTTDGVVPTITAVYETTGPTNMISVGHYPKMGVGVIYET